MIIIVLLESCVESEFIGGLAFQPVHAKNFNYKTER